MTTSLQSFYAGKAIFITGASSGLGRAVAEAVARYRVKLGLVGRNTENLQKLAENLRDTGSECHIYTCDVQDRQAVQNAVQAFQQQTGVLDIAWVNSGISRSTFFPKWQWDEVEAIVQTNIMGAIYTTKACADVMVQQNAGAIVAIGSVASMRGLPKHGIYSMSKIALNHYIESLMAELPQLQITLIHPGFVDTAINRGNPNRFFLMTPEKAAQHMLSAVARQKRVYIFPWQFRLLYPLIRALPAGLYQLLARQLVKMRK